MKTTLFLIAITGTILLGSCCKKHEPTSTKLPPCITTEIEQMKADSVRNPAGSVWRYTYHGQTVYFIPAACCDFQSVLYNSNCEVICHPDGGITGAGDGQCSDFFSTRQNETLIWQDSRVN